jgi:stress responsive alpha/beta barrel protein
MIVSHVVVLKPKPGTTIEEIQTVLEQVKELQPIISGLLEVRAGRNLANPDSHGHTHGFIMRFSDETHMRAYFDTPLPQHKAVGEELQRICSYMAFDIPYWNP